MTKLEAALNYAALGWFVIPLCWPDPAGKCACGWNHPEKSTGKAPRIQNGVSGASSDPTRITSWWGEFPDANIGVAAQPSNLIILDADGPAAIEEVQSLGLPTGTPTAVTAGGRHYYFTRPAGTPLVPHTHLGTSGGLDLPLYAIAPPSRHRSGRDYYWEIPPSGQPPVAPDWLISLMTPKASSPTVGDPPTQEEAASACSDLLEAAPARALAIHSGVAPTQDRSGAAYELARALVESGAADPYQIACAVYTSAPHRAKFDRRPDGWLDAFRTAHRALTAADSPEAPAPTPDHNLEIPRLVPLSTIPREPIRFLIDPYVPRGEITLLEGDPGEGKSFVCMALAAGLTGSKLSPVPYDNTAPTNCRVAVLTTEDSLGKTVRGRFEDLGADLDRILVFSFPGKAGEEAQITAANLAAVEPQILAAAPDLLVVDPITLYATGDPKFDMDKNTHVRNLLKPLLALVRRLDCACLIVRHYRKGAGRAIYRGLGSIDVTATARSQLSIGRDRVTGNHILAHAKSNLARRGESLYFTLTEGIPPLRWLGVAEGVTADDLTGDEKDVEKRAALEEAVDFLRDLLKDGPVTAKAIEAAAKEDGISNATLRRARKTLDLRKGWLTKDTTCWYLPDHQQIFEQMRFDLGDGKI